MQEDTTQKAADVVTNGEMIRAMCDQELAEYMSNIQVFVLSEATGKKVEDMQDLWQDIYTNYLAYLGKPYGE